MSNPSHSATALYQDYLDAGRLQPDPQQLELLPVLDQLVQQLNHPVQRVSWRNVSVWRGEQGAAVPKGLYLHGPVGRGKSMLMQLVFDATTEQHKRRVHFHPFMEELHHRIHHARPPRNMDLMLHVAEQLLAEVRLLCFDEFYITNIADGMLLGRLLEALFQCGVTLCVTSNWAPENIFQDGINRGRVLPFIDILRRHVQEVALDRGSDWRRCSASQTEEKRRPLDIFTHLAGQDPDPKPITLRHMTVETIGAEQGVYWFDFDSLCARSIGRAEYMELCRLAKIVILSGIPPLSADMADYAMRFIVLVDLLYEHRIALHTCGTTNLDQICTEGPAAFAFQRTLSRIHELGNMAALSGNSP
ncbi:MAG: cell division protein ZapE [Magnetococcales bacterium]|nr:cell division protein ZapE [Magnetococcales bacterium]